MNIMGINKSGGYAVHDQAKEMVRLSEGLEIDGLLKNEPISRTIKALKYFTRLLKVYDVEIEDVYALSTAAVRVAKNQKAFLERVQKETGLVFRVLSGREEAFYDYLGVVNGIQCDDAVIVDIGGGSTEIIHVENRQFKNAISIPYGSVILTEHFKNEKSRKAQMEKCESFMKKLYKDIPWFDDIKGLPIIGLGGIIRTLGKVDRNTNRSSDEILHDYTMNTKDLYTVFERIQETELKEMDKIEGISKRRSDLMPMGIVPIKVLYALIDSPRLSISGNGLREGYFFEKYFKEQSEPVVVENVLRHSKYNIMRLYSANIPHAIHVKMLALSLFDQLKEIHQFTAEDRGYLSVAAMLHDIGMYIGYYDHHIHGMYLMMNARIDGLNKRGHMAVAFLVGNHRESQLKDRVKYFETTFDKKEIESLQKLSILLQLAEQLDRSVTGMVKALDVTLEKGEVFMRLVADELPELDVQSAMRFSDRFEKHFGHALKVYY